MNGWKRIKRQINCGCTTIVAELIRVYGIRRPQDVMFLADLVDLIEISPDPNLRHESDLGMLISLYFGDWLGRRNSEQKRLFAKIMEIEDDNIKVVEVGRKTDEKQTTPIRIL